MMSTLHYTTLHQTTRCHYTTNLLSAMLQLRNLSMIIITMPRYAGLISSHVLKIPSPALTMPAMTRKIQARAWW